MPFYRKVEGEKKCQTKRTLHNTLEHIIIKALQVKFSDRKLKIHKLSMVDQHQCIVKDATAIDISYALPKTGLQ